MPDQSWEPLGPEAKKPQRKPSKQANHIDFETTGAENQKTLEETKNNYKPNILRLWDPKPKNPR